MTVIAKVAAVDLAVCACQSGAGVVSQYQHSGHGLQDRFGVRFETVGRFVYEQTSPK